MYIKSDWERADLLALVGEVYCIFVTFPSGILVQVWHLIVSFPDLYRLSYFYDKTSILRSNASIYISMHKAQLFYSWMKKNITKEEQ